MAHLTINPGKTSPTRWNEQWRPSEFAGSRECFASVDGQFILRGGMPGWQVLERVSMTDASKGWQAATPKSQAFTTPREAGAFVDEYRAKLAGMPRCENRWTDKSGAPMQCHNPATAGRYHRPEALGGDMNVCKQCIPVLLDRVIVTYRVGEAA